MGKGRACIFFTIYYAMMRNPKGNADKLYFTLFAGPSFLVNYKLMLILHFGYESMAVVYGPSSLEVLDFGKTRSYGP